MKYENATNILPAKLLEEIWKHFPGGLLWVPKKDDPNLERDEFITKLVQEKVLIKEIATLAQITPRQVHRIVKKRTSKKQRPEN